MFRRFSVYLVRGSMALALILCLACSAQSPSPDLSKRIESHIRAKYSIPPQVPLAIGDRKPSADFAGYDVFTVGVGEKKEPVEFLLSKDEKTLVRITKLSLEGDPYAEILAKMDLKGRPVRGNKDAKVTVVNYDDFQCPFCSRMHKTLFPELAQAYGDKVRFIYKDFPLVEIHPWAKHAAVDSNCLADQNNEAYWGFTDRIHDEQRNISGPIEGQYAAVDRIALELGQKHGLDLIKLQSCLKAQNTAVVDASMKEGTALGIEATPTLFINGQKLDGAIPAPEMRAILDKALKDAGVEPPAPPAAAAPTPASK